MSLPTKLRMMAKGCFCNGDVIRADALALAATDADRLTEENAKLRELLSDIMECVNQDLWDTRCDDAKQLLNQLKEQNNDK